ncbi:uncharacterized protein LOC110722305 [Chenopodium quinoa]|uniref:uncharacterized protein LOC110722305 n=1 Tax=Chenopodium quinoa TaxID=63459 RepID=UPI000B79154D|nr:uncharacterized protein LOC110722305 [Chenopodium quinoa]
MRDEVGDVVILTCLRVEGSFEADVAEALAMRHALSITLESGFRKVCLETDCLKLHNHLIKGVESPTTFGMIVKDIRALASLCQSVSFSFVKRSGNCVAHGLAKLCNQVVELRVWLEEYPNDVAALVLADCSHFD